MAQRKPKYLVDEKGKTTGVLLNISDYRKLLRRIEDLEDALELDEAVESAKSFRDYRDIRKELKEEGRL